jgi:hypothetical protein
VEKTIKAIADFFVKVLPTFEKSRSGWIKVAAIALIASGCYVLVAKIDYNAELDRQHKSTGIKKPADDFRPCKVYGDSIICD